MVFSICVQTLVFFWLVIYLYKCRTLDNFCFPWLFILGVYFLHGVRCSKHVFTSVRHLEGFLIAFRHLSFFFWISIFFHKCWTFGLFFINFSFYKCWALRIVLHPPFKHLSFFAKFKFFWPKHLAISVFFRLSWRPSLTQNFSVLFSKNICLFSGFWIFFYKCRTLGKFLLLRHLSFFSDFNKAQCRTLGNFLFSPALFFLVILFHTEFNNLFFKHLSVFYVSIFLV